MSIASMSNSLPIVQAKKKAKRLKSFLKPRLPEISLGECLNIISRLENERDWNSYLAKLQQAASTREHGDKAENYIKKTILPLIASIAAKHKMNVILDPAKIENCEATDLQPNRKRISMRIEPIQPHGGTYCEPFLDASMTSLRFGCDWTNVKLNFIFPKEAFSVVAKLISGNKICNDAEPQITRFETLQEKQYMLTLNTSGVSDTVDHGLNIQTDQTMLKVLQKGFDRFFVRYCRVINAYMALRGRWGNKKLVTNLENSIWKLNCDDPTYMAVSNYFYSTTIAGLVFHGVLGSAGPYILGEDGSIEIGVCSIIYLENEDNETPKGYYIAKYGDSWQTSIYLKGFNESDINTLTAEFGIPRGRFPEKETSFYQTSAFDALCDWTVKNPLYAKRVGRDEGRYLPDWYEKVVARKFTQDTKTTKQDFLNAIEKEPYLIDQGIRCSFHIDQKKSAEENKAVFHSQRESFARFGYKEFILCCEWLHGCNQRKTINSSFSSYKLKHMVEAWARKSGKGNQYVSNGAFIAAAIHMGFDWKPDFDSPNVRFNISGKSPAITALKETVII
ncbi:hypothetical protein Pcar_0786 [Syntrophotalea carbinolica DSM 2380]|uniref:Glyoxalase-related protein domain-containing protein n=1 Tax=Syntrophotalea carbinolica (strain DSM 2380 / NBRC 103641 / GraBd1) TaxID=338963 RepID=Q3A6G3_SYNC1|nr:glyoxalase superfamily protein [Syntrophotalea carbinolica]ABA88044.1 hypothetical protein Pcar_0786 [Syntrophotalea carbinolica DSM 2380]